MGVAWGECWRWEQRKVCPAPDIKGASQGVLTRLGLTWQPCWEGTCWESHPRDPGKRDQQERAGKM